MTEGAAHDSLVSYSRKVFVPVTRLCRDVCHYCTYAKTPSAVEHPFMTLDEVLDTARVGRDAGCKEVLFTLGDKPELRYKRAKVALDELGFASTLAYVAYLAEQVFLETGLLPHINAGVMSSDEVAMLRRVSVSQGLMLESASRRLCERGGPHFGSPDKQPHVRLETIRAAGELKVPFTSGILIGIGETRAERTESLEALSALQDEFGHLQEIIIQNFRAKLGTKMAKAPEPGNDELTWTIGEARRIFGTKMNIQSPPNLNSGQLASLIEAGINDWGGVSPVTPDFVNPEAPWPHLDKLAEETADAGRLLVERLAIYPEYLLADTDWIEQHLLTAALQFTDSNGLVRANDWTPGQSASVPFSIPDHKSRRKAKVSRVSAIVRSAVDGRDLNESQIVTLFSARGDEFIEVCSAADDLRRSVNGDTITYVVNRNINYTNVCYFRCSFCAFSKGKHDEDLRGPSYDLGLEEIARRAREAFDRGATEVCLQGGIHPKYTGETYINICKAIKSAAPELHIHAFSPLEIWQGANTLQIGVSTFLERLQSAGLTTLPGTAAEILDDEIRRIICPDKITTTQWVDVITTAHDMGLKTTSTIMFGHVDQPRHWARHLLILRDLQRRTGGITEFVPLPFVHNEAPMFIKGTSRKGPTYRESILMHAVARLALHPHIRNIQTSWVKMGMDGAKACLSAGCNDFGGTLMNESITRAAGGANGQEVTPDQLRAAITSLGRNPLQRTTLYHPAEARDRIMNTTASQAHAVSAPSSAERRSIRRSA